MKTERLPDAELDIMKELWKSTVPLKASDIAKRLSEKHSWKVPTVHAFLSRLEEKGFVTVDRSSYFHRFLAAFSEADYIASESSALLQKSGTRLPTLVSALMDSDDVTDEELNELSALIDAKLKALREKRRETK